MADRIALTADIRPLAPTGTRASGFGAAVTCDDGDRDLLAYLRADPGCVQRLLDTHRAVLFTGFQVDFDRDFAAIARLACGTLVETAREHPQIADRPGVYRTVLHAPSEKLLWHNENSFYDTWPRTIVFGCCRPAASGGATPLADSADVYAAMDSDVRERFHRLGVQYIRNCIPGFGRGWQDLYQTDDRAQVAAIAAARAERITWYDTDRLRIEAVRPAFIRHDISGRWVWFNQILHWHPACLPAALRGMLEARLGGDNMPRNCRFGDGTVIPDDVIRRLIQAYQAHEIQFPWHAGDVLVVDNVACAHAREPYAGERTHLVAMGRPGSFNDECLSARPG